MISAFDTIAGPAEGLYKEKGSKFISLVWPVTTEAEIKQHLADTRKTYFDARHQCFAFVLGADQSVFRAFDDGEPNHSAGDPILRQIRSRGLTNILIIVVRYFGGTKLGVGGLTQAYKLAAEDALTKTVTVTETVTTPHQLRFDYDAYPELMKLVKRMSLKIKSQDLEKSILALDVPVANDAEFREKISLMAALGHEIQIVPPA